MKMIKSKISISLGIFFVVCLSILSYFTIYYLNATEILEQELENISFENAYFECVIGCFIDTLDADIYYINSSDINEEYVKIANSRLSETASVVTLVSPTFPTEKAINKDLTATPTPKEFQKEIPSLNPDIKRNLNQVIK
jgi:predicted membrane-bound dolichyl-phosphate-mannose-protein mannosyltransferase